MKKFVLFTILMFAFAVINAQYAVEEKSFIKKIDEKQKNKGVDAAIKYIEKEQLGFIHNEWMYVASYTNTKQYIGDSDRDFIRDAFLYRRKINTHGKWEEANPNKLFTSQNILRNRMSIYEMQRIEKVKTKNGVCYMIFIDMRHYYESSFDLFTQFFFFYPIDEYKDGSVYYGIHKDIDWNSVEGKKSFEYGDRNENVFYNKDKDFKFKVNYKLNDGRLKSIMKTVH